MPFGDGRLIAESIQRALSVVTRYLQGTEGQGSLFLIWGGLVIIGFLAMSHVFRTLILSDLAPLANPPTPRPQALTRMRTAPEPQVEFRLGRNPTTARHLGTLAGRRTRVHTLDGLLDAFHDAGLGEPRIVESRGGLKRIRIRDAAPPTPAGCAYALGFLHAGFQALLEEPVEAHKIACIHQDAKVCEYRFTYGGDEA